MYLYYITDVNVLCMYSVFIKSTMFVYTVGIGVEEHNVACINGPFNQLVQYFTHLQILQWSCQLVDLVKGQPSCGQTGSQPVSLQSHCWNWGSWRDQTGYQDWVQRGKSTGA